MNRCGKSWIAGITGAIFFLAQAQAHPLSAQQSDDAHLGLPPLNSPADNPPSPEKIRLGRQLFFDARLSQNGKISCAHCHKPEITFSDGMAHSKGIREQLGTRNAPTVINAAYNTSQFWDGRRATLEEQALDPLVNPREHGLKSHDSVLVILRGEPAYREGFAKAFPEAANPITVQNAGKAIAAFERTLIAGDSPFDHYYFKGEKNALSASAQRGLALFVGSARCVGCHTIQKEDALFTDNQFHSLHVGMKRIEMRLPYLTSRLVELRKGGQPLDHTVLNDDELAELGRFSVTLKPADIGQFRTPSLRNVALTAPYMHDGSIATLDDAVEFEIYYRSAENGVPLILTPLEKRDLTEFLKSLTSSDHALSKLAR